MAIAGTALSAASASTVAGAKISAGFDADPALEGEAHKPVPDFQMFTVDIEQDIAGAKLSAADDGAAITGTTLGDAA